MDWMMGRPSKRTPEIEEQIIAALSEGTPLAEVCRQEGMPHPTTVRDWMAADEAFSLAIARAREDGEDRIAADCLRIADTPLLGQTVRSSDKDGQVITEEDMLGHRKLQIETRLKLLAKWNPRKWGERVAVDHGVQDNLAEQLKAARERAGLV